MPSRVGSTPTSATASAFATSIRVTGDQLARLRTLVRSEILGVAGDESVLGGVEVIHALSDTVFQLDDTLSLPWAMGQASRWGHL